jgi:hypothetical protein
MGRRPSCQSRIEFFKQRSGRQPDWQYQLAQARSASGIRRLPKQYKLLSELRQMLKIIRSAAPGRSPGQLASRLREHYGSLYLAYELHTAPAYTSLREEVEVRILAAQNDAEVSQATDLPPEVIRVYEQVFFSVRDKLTADWYIFTQVICADRLGTAVTPAESARQWLYKLGYALQGGGLEQLLAIRRSSDSGTGPAYQEIVRRLLLNDPKLHPLLSAQRPQRVANIIHQLLADCLNMQPPAVDSHSLSPALSQSPGEASSAVDWHSWGKTG